MLKSAVLPVVIGMAFSASAVAAQSAPAAAERQTKQQVSQQTKQQANTTAKPQPSPAQVGTKNDCIIPPVDV